MITVKTYPIPSKKYDELVCTAGVTESGDFIRLYPINFRDLPFPQKYVKYQWVEILANKHSGRDARKESYRPYSSTIKLLGEPIPSNPGNWSERAKFVLKKKSHSMEDLKEQQIRDRTSLGIFRPKKIHDLIISSAKPDWSPKFLDALNQVRLFESRRKSLVPPRKVPFKFQYHFECDDARCSGSHKMMIEDWEAGALFWKLVDNGQGHEEAAKKVKEKFLNKICAPENDTHFYVGTILAHPSSWVVIGVFYPKIESNIEESATELTLFR